MNAKRTIAFAALTLATCASVYAAGSKIEGRVTDATNGRPVPNQTLQLLMPSGGMQQVGTATTDASGRYAFSGSDFNAPFYLVQAVYQGVNYHAPVRFDGSGAAQVDLTVYDSTRKAPQLRIQNARLIVRAEGSKAHVQEMFAVRNDTNPPVSYVNPDGTFRFRLSKTAGQPTATVAGLMNMPLPQSVNQGPGQGESSLDYPLKPGLTVVMIAYDADYTSNQLQLGDSVAYPIDSADLLVSPSNLAVNSNVFKANGADSESGSQKYSANGMAAGALLAASLSGEGGGGATTASDSETQVMTTPNSMNRLGLPLLACFLLILLWGLGVRMAKEWPRLKARQSADQVQKALAAELDGMFNSLADLDELFANGKIAEKPYWKERLELKARLVARLKKAPTALLESYATRKPAPKAGS